MSGARKRKKRRFSRRRKRHTPILLISLIFLACIGIVVGQGAFLGNVDEAFNETSGTVSENEPITDGNSFSELSTLDVHFLDVGQGDCALLLCNGYAMLIDAGDDNQGTKIQDYLKKRGIEKLDYLVLTHPDADHIGGASVVITKFEIEQVFMTDYGKETAAYEKVLDALEYRYLKWSMPDIGSTFSLGSARITIVGPREQYEDSNNSSLVLMVEHGKNKFLFTGDAEEEAERDLVETWQHSERYLNVGYDKSFLQVDVLKLAHHGSKTSTGETLLNAVNPQYAVISCGEGNLYGFPHAQPLNYLRERGIQVFRTDEQGSIVVTSDGVNLSWNCTPSITWQVGEIK